MTIPRQSPIRLYIAGPMSGVPQHNYPAFDEAANALRAAGYLVVNPARDNGVPEGQPWEAYMRADIPLLCECDGVAYLMGAATPRQMQLSRGLRLERAIAEALHMPIHPVKWWIGQAAIEDALERQAARRVGVV